MWVSMCPVHLSPFRAGTWGLVGMWWMKTPSMRCEPSPKRAAGWWELLHWWWEIYLCLNCSWKLLETGMDGRSKGLMESTARQGMWGWKTAKGGFLHIPRVIKKKKKILLSASFKSGIMQKSFYVPLKFRQFCSKQSCPLTGSINTPKRQELKWI